MLIYLENLCCCCSNLVEAVEDLGQSSLKHILDNFVWIIAIVSLPGRILAALRRGRQVSPLAPLFLDCHLCLFNNDIFCLCFFSLFFFYHRFVFVENMYKAKYSSNYGSRFFIDNISMTFICLQVGVNWVLKLLLTSMLAINGYDIKVKSLERSNNYGVSSKD